MTEQGRSLDAYRAKRDFSASPEPEGAVAPGTGRRFVVQMHAARRLHYDFRLEWGGVLLSWAVTRGPSLDPSAKRLAVRTEDHPVDYAGFEGVIPAGEYGGGTVLLWDRGTWTPLEDFGRGLAEGKLKFALAGERMRGAWTLVRMKPRPGERAENWLLIKERDGREAEGPEALVEAHSSSVASGRSLEEIAAGAAAKRGKRGRAAAPPAFREPQFAELAAEVPRGAAWLHEIKYDGYRCLAAVGGGRVRLYSRSGLDWTERFGALVPDFAALACRSALIDGEVIASGERASGFSELQDRLSSGGPLTFVAFDLLEIDGRDMTGRALKARKARLEKLLAAREAGAIQFSTHVEGHGAEVLAGVCAAGQEGVVSKLASGIYREGRHSSWRKVKCERRQEFVIGGWLPSRARRRPFASLLMGTFEGGALRYRGKVGSGFGERDFARIAPRLQALAAEASPFVGALRAEVRGARWLEPRLVGEVSFAELTEDGRIRQGVFHGLREDKAVAEVELEREAAPGAAKAKAKAKAKEGALVGGVRVSSPERRVFERPPVTKLQVAEHYAALAERMLPFAGKRPVSLLRCPDGIEGECFFQKHLSPGMPDAVGRVSVGETREGAGDYICLSGAAGLVGAAQMGTIEFHVWGARADRLETPDRLVFDLDPDEGLPFARVRAAAAEMRDRLAELGLPSAPMVTGGKGVHVIVPLRPKASWDTAKLFCRALATLMAEAAPKRYVATMAKAERKGRIFIDWLRNERGATAVAPYSLRARPGAKVATPVSWEELAGLRSAGAFDIASIRARLEAPCPLREASRRPAVLGPATVARLEKAARL